MNKNNIGKSFNPYILSSENGLKEAMNIAKKLQQKSRQNLTKNQKIQKPQQNIQQNIPKANQLSDDQIKNMLKIAQRQNNTLKNKVNENSTFEEIVETINKENQQHTNQMLDDLFPDL